MGVNYSTFGVKMNGRKFIKQDYRVDFNNKETDEETEWQDYGMRMYDTRLARFMNIDPLTYGYPELTPFQFASNTPICAIDLDGLEMFYATDGSYIGQIGSSTAVRVCDASETENMKGLISMNHNSIDPKMQEYSKSQAYAKSSNLGMTNGELNARAFLSTIKQCENGGNEPLDYNSWNGFVNGVVREFTEKSFQEAPSEYGDHPGYPKGSGSSAAGAYQFLEGPYKDFQKAYPDQLKDFSPESQDRAALLLLRERRALTNVLNGDLDAAVNKLNKPVGGEAWSSLPGASESHVSMAKFKELFAKNKINELNNNSNIATPKGQLLNFERAPNTAPPKDKYKKFPDSSK